LIDTMDGAAEKAYGGWPAGTAVVDLEGKIALSSRGPSGARPKEAEKALKAILAAQAKGKAEGGAKESPRPKPGD